MEINIQDAVLSSFLWANDLAQDTKDAFLLNVGAFTGNRKLIASKINEVTETEDRFYSLLNLELENTSQIEWLDMSKLTPMPFNMSLKYHEKLIQTMNNKLLRGY